MTVETGSIKKEYKEYQKVDPSVIFETAPSKKKFIERYFKDGENIAKVDLELSFKKIEKENVITWTLKHVVKVCLEENGEVIAFDKSGNRSNLFNDEVTSPKQIFDNAKNRRHIIETEGNNTYISKEEFIDTYFNPESSYCRDKASINVTFIFITEDGYKERFDALEVYWLDNDSVIGRDRHGISKVVYDKEIEPYSVFERNNHHNKKYIKKCLERLFKRIRI